MRQIPAPRPGDHLKALADLVRLSLIFLVFAPISHHLKVLHDARLLDREKRGVWAYYRIRTEALASVAAVVAYTPPPAVDGASAPCGSCKQTL